MTGDEQDRQLTFRVSPRELETITRAARLERPDAGDIATWVRAVVLRRASELVERHERQSLAATLEDVGYQVELPATDARCECGKTRDPGGECDGSCVTRA